MTYPLESMSTLCMYESAASVDAHNPSQVIDVWFNIAHQLSDEPEWEIATFLPAADWNKASATKVYSDSRKKLNVN